MVKVFEGAHNVYGMHNYSNVDQKVSTLYIFLFLSAPINSKQYVHKTTSIAKKS